jgi:hypothetical protein
VVAATTLHPMFETVPSTGRSVVLTGWANTSTDRAARVVEHAIRQATVDRHLAVCGTPLPVVNRALPWSGRDAECCPDCVAAVMRAA